MFGLFLDCMCKSLNTICGRFDVSRPFPQQPLSGVPSHINKSSFRSDAAQMLLTGEGMELKLNKFLVVSGHVMIKVC